MLEKAGIDPRLQPSFRTAAKQPLARPVGYAILRCESLETVGEAVLAEPGDMALPGARALEGFGVPFDNMAYRFVSQVRFVAWHPDALWPRQRCPLWSGR
jgi:hypothetical protein